jgi:uncharacterized protein (DUF433 family)
MTSVKTAVKVSEDDIRVTAPIFTAGEVATITGITPSTAYNWSRRDLITNVHARRRGWPTIPLLGLAEYEIFRGMREAKLPMPEVAAIARFIRTEISQYGFLSRDIVHDGTMAYLQENDELERLTNGQFAIYPVIEERLKPFAFDQDGLIFEYQVKRVPGVVIDPRFNGGRMMFEQSSVPLFAVAGMLNSGERPEVVAREYGITDQQVAAVKADLQWISQAA